MNERQVVIYSSLITLRSSLLFCRCERGLEDARVRAATTEVAFAGFAHFVERGLWVLFEISRDGCDEAGRAEAAHERVVRDEGGLRRVRLIGRAQAFDGRDLFADRINRKHETRIDWLIVNEYR